MEESILTAPASDTPCRAVTADEIAHYKEYGWVKLKQFVDPGALREILDAARAKMGDDADSNPVYEGVSIEYFNAEFGNGLENPLIRRVMEGVAKGGKQLLAREDGTGVRWYQDIFVPKLPAGKKARHGGTGATDFHQDFISFAVDRTGGMTCWIPMESYGPESGTMAFVSKSQTLGSLGDYRTYNGRDIRDVYPEINRLEMTEPMHYELGDITIHNHLLVHGAGKNLTDRPRWAYLLILQPADACWTGQPCVNFDHSAMEPWQRFDDERFPVLG